MTATAHAQDIQIDPRGYRFGAAVTLAVALIAVLLGSDAGLMPMAILVLMFLPGAIVGPQATVQSWLFKRLIRARLTPPTETESFRPPRFAQQMGLAMSALALVFGLLDVAAGFYVFGVLVLIASFLNAVFGFCLGCEIYLAVKKATTRAA
ncbi:DUF4395 domain-containing protein [Demequina sp. NBRC 110051]|uniref:DUF4395 domain-containing protein n=1 Tax=Demequina sp. NBRC 110051 TaxID=1570340 RepID=UPI000A061A92|nr:DUF4395 domain-containing protein [Demequina sp. NBRC 110051]